MNARNKIASVMGGAAMIASVIGMTAGLAPAAAAPKQIGANLHIVQDPHYPANYLLTVTGRYPMSHADAQGFLNNINNGKCKGFLGYIVFGDDGGPVKVIHSVEFPGEHADGRGFWKAGPGGLEYRREFSLLKSDLNEDSDGTDEIFARAIFRDSDCVDRRHTSQVVTGNF
jgi:hypothetical protein